MSAPSISVRWTHRRPRSSTRDRVARAILISLLLTACSGSGHRVVRTEEGGVPVVGTIGGPLVQGDPFRMEREQVFGDPARGIDGRLMVPGGYVETPDGGLAVFDRATEQVKIYTAEGRFRLAVGGKGDGPGEFDGGWMNHGLTPDGKILVTDGGNFRLTRIDPADGSFELLTLRDVATWDAAQVGEDRFVLIHARRLPDLSQSEALELTDGSFQTLKTLASVPVGRVMQVGETATRPPRPLIVSKPFWPGFSWWAQNGLVGACQGTSFRVELFDAAGDPVRIVEWDAPLKAVDDSMWAAAQRNIKEQFRDDWPTVWRALERPAYLPSIEGIRLDDAGRIWALRRDPSERWGGQPDTPLAWDVIASDGAWLGTQSMPQVARYHGRDVCYVTEDLEEGSVVVRYRLIPVASLRDR